MKTLAAAIATTFFAAGVGAADWYDDFTDGNTDVSNQRVSAAEFAGVQPSIGDTVERYHGLANGNSDLFNADRSGRSGATSDPSIYRELGGNPDIEVWGP